MPPKNTIKFYVKDTYYHIYNRGVNKNKIYKDEEDYGVFLSYLKQSLLPPPPPNELPRIRVHVQGTSFTRFKKPPKNFFKEINLIAYCLMPNHFHLLIKQKTNVAMESFMRSIATRYSMYFNKKYDRVGTLFQGIYKASPITEEKYLLHLSRYIHINPIKYTENIVDAYSSYKNYLGLKKQRWVKSKVVLSYFKSSKDQDTAHFESYKNFIDEYKKEPADILGDLTID